MSFPKLTKLEREILDHRLTADDAIAESLPDYHEDDVRDVCKLLLNGNVADAEGISRQLVADVLEDAVDGSTFFGAASAESNQMQSAILRAGESLAEKIGKYIGRKIVFPAY